MKKEKNLKKYYIAYGSNLNIEQMGELCKNAKIEGTSVLKDYKLVFRGTDNPYANVEHEKSSTVPVLIWCITEDDEISLDEFEDYPHLYHKEMMSVDLNHQTITAMIYIMNEGIPYGIPTDDYYSRIVDGYISAGFNLDFLEMSLKNTQDKVK